VGSTPGVVSWSTRRRLTGYLIAAVALTLALASPAGASVTPLASATGSDVLGSVGLRLVDIPVSESDDPRAQLYIVDHLAPGASIDRRIEVSNTATSTLHVLLYAAAATIDDGSFLGTEGRTPNELSSWTTVSPRSIDVPSGGAEIAEVAISIPDDAAPGERYAAVWAEVRSDVADPEGVVQVSRVGLRLYVSVGPGNAPAPDFEIDALTAMRSSEGEPLVVATVRNTGGRALDMGGTLKLVSGPGGLTAGPFPAVLGTTLAIADTESVTIALDRRLPAGPWDARVALHSGLLERTVRATITFPAVGTSAPVKTTGGGMALMPFLVGGACLSLIGLAVLFVSRRRRERRRRAGTARRAAREPVAVP
jgi:hypothetical protein